MPSWRTHTFFNVIIFIFWLKVLFSFSSPSILYPIVVLFFVILASVFPDIDTSRSKIRDWVSLLLATLIMLFYILISQPVIWYRIPLYFLLLYLLIRFFPTTHRGKTHSIWFSLVFSFAATIILFYMFTINSTTFVLTFSILFLSYNSHLILDKVIKTTK